MKGIVSKQWLGIVLKCSLTKNVYKYLFTNEAMGSHPPKNGFFEIFAKGVGGLPNSQNLCLPTPLAGGQEKSFAEQMNFLGLWPGGWAFNFWHQFWFSTVPPQGGSFVGSPFGAIPRFSGYIQFSTVLPQGGSFVGSPLCIGNIYIRIDALHYINTAG